MNHGRRPSRLPLPPQPIISQSPSHSVDNTRIRSLSMVGSSAQPMSPSNGKLPTPPLPSPPPAMMMYPNSKSYTTLPFPPSVGMPRADERRPMTEDTQYDPDGNTPEDDYEALGSINSGPSCAIRKPSSQAKANQTLGGLPNYGGRRMRSAPVPMAPPNPINSFGCGPYYGAPMPSTYDQPMPLSAMLRALFSADPWMQQQSMQPPQSNIPQMTPLPDQSLQYRSGQAAPESGFEPDERREDDGADHYDRYRCHFHNSR
ncbi:hypothetical protein RDWZM_006475 [Blomia tropicalis]|uniref:Uncharacterized protein n=1 Tax=Blomia tropicalis TaxID=40697 RepID=A0A9Q0M8J8_BLOTA|nr:hypothetical protein BLOT_008577 [Blomia tropicalis]KAJ6220663.1 hypothetical protein RDWZM_006475 [Blomia tropicalis]